MRRPSVLEIASQAADRFLCPACKRTESIAAAVERGLMPRCCGDEMLLALHPATGATQAEA